MEAYGAHPFTPVLRVNITSYRPEPSHPYAIMPCSTPDERSAPPSALPMLDRRCSLGTQSITLPPFRVCSSSSRHLVAAHPVPGFFFPPLNFPSRFDLIDPFSFQGFGGCAARRRWLLPGSLMRQMQSWERHHFKSSKTASLIQATLIAAYHLSLLTPLASCHLAATRFCFRGTTLICRVYSLLTSLAVVGLSSVCCRSLSTDYNNYFELRISTESIVAPQLSGKVYVTSGASYTSRQSVCAFKALRFYNRRKLVKLFRFIRR